MTRSEGKGKQKPPRFSRRHAKSTNPQDEGSSGFPFTMTPARVYLFNFFLFSALGSVMSFLPVFYGLIGFSSFENGLLYAARPLISFWWGPLCASVATSTRYRQLILFICVAGAIASTFCISILHTNDGGVLKVSSCQLAGGYHQENFLKNSVDIHKSAGQTSTTLNERGGVENNSSSDSFSAIFEGNSNETKAVDNHNSWRTLISKTSTIIYRKLKKGIVMQSLFMYVLLLTVLSELFLSPTLHMAQATIRYNRHQSLFNNICLSRISSKIGMAVSAFTISYIAWKYQCLFKYVHYFYFHFYAFFATGCITALLSLILPREAPSKHSFLRTVCKGCGYVTSDWSTTGYIFGLWVAGMAEGALGAYLLWFAASNGASELIIGMLVAIALITDVVLHWSVGFSTRWIGYSGLLCFGIIIMSTQFYLLTVISNPIYLIPCQLLYGLASSCIKSSLVSCAQSNGSKEIERVLCFVFQGVYLGLGLGLGGVFVSMPYFVFGPKKTFLGLSIFMLCYSVLHIIIQCIACKKSSQRPKKAMYTKVDDFDASRSGDWLLDALEEDELQDTKEDFITVEEKEHSSAELQTEKQNSSNNNT